MCGITGFIDRNRSRSRERFAEELERMTSAIQHRGPDDSGIWIDAHAGAALGFRRLSIIDLSAAGHQPMESASGRYVITFNGEVYNFERLRAELDRERPGIVYRGHSDSEVILAAIETWGLEPAVKKFIGMFAFALWDRQRGVLSLVRDRLGVKPLYYGWSGDLFVYGSELKALRAHSRFSAELDRDAVALMLQHAYIPAPYTVYRDLRKVIPGTILEVPCEDVRAARTIPYWSARDAVAAGRSSLITDEREAIDGLEELLRDSIGLRMISDVPLGVFLSGGIDSSLVTALMQAQSSRPVKSFSIGFHESAYDEARQAKAVARHLGTEHTELYVTTAEAQDVIPMLPSMYDEPFGDSSQIPTYLVSALARRHVTVTLSGDGGDELFGGYNRYRWSEPIWRRAKFLPGPLRRAAGASLRSMASPNSLAGHIAERLIARSGPRLFRDKLRKAGQLLSARNENEAYRTLISQIPDGTAIVNGAFRAPWIVDDETFANGTDNLAHRMMLLDMVSYLPDDILAKVDRASMAVSLEAREPLLDHRIVEYAWRLPLSMKVHGGTTKWILRQLLYRHVPADLVDRPKMGFSIPLDVWLRTDLRDWAEALLAESRLRGEGILRPEPVRALWRDHVTGREDRQHQIWNVLMFEAWLEEQRRVPATGSTALRSVVMK